MTTYDDALALAAKVGTLETDLTAAVKRADDAAQIAAGLADDLELATARVSALTSALDQANRLYSDHMKTHEPPKPVKVTLLGGSYGGADESLYKQRAKVARIFCTGNLPTNVTSATGWKQAYDDGVRVFILSWKGIQTGAQVAACLKTIPADCTVYGSYFHEPEDNIGDGSLTLAAWKARHVEHAQAMRTVGVIPVGIFMQYTLTNGSGRNIMDYSCGDDGVLFDFYMNAAKGKVNPEDAVTRMSAAAKQMGAKFCGTAETGVNMAGTSETVALDLTKRCRAALIADPLMTLGTWWSTNEFKFTEATATAWFEGR